MKYKTLVAKQIEKTDAYTRFQYALNTKLDYTSPIIEFKNEILKEIPEKHIEYALDQAKNKNILLNGSILETSQEMSISQWAPIMLMSQIFDYYKKYNGLPLILINADQETRSKYTNKELIENLF
jgi:hypothetical protein